MCCCGKPTINGQMGYRWNDPDGPPGVRPVNPPDTVAGDAILYDEPGRCGGLDSHCHHYLVIRNRHGAMSLYVRHGGGDEHIRLSGPLTDALAVLDSTPRYWILNAIYHAHADAARNARESEAQRWRTAAAEKRIKVRKQRGNDHVRVSIKTVT